MAPRSPSPSHTGSSPNDRPATPTPRDTVPRASRACLDDDPDTAVAHRLGFAPASRRPLLAAIRSGSGPLSVMHQSASRTRLRSRSGFARPYICLLIILMRLTWPSTAPEL